MDQSYSWKFFEKIKWEFTKFIYILLESLLYFLLYLRPQLEGLQKGDSFEDPIFLIFILSVCICSDIGGYIIGKNNWWKKIN